MSKKSNFLVLSLSILFCVGLGVGFFIGSLVKERSQLVQIVPTEYTKVKSEIPGFDAFKIYDSDKLLSDEMNTQTKNFVAGQEGKLNEENIVPPDPETHVQAIEIPQFELEVENQFYEHPENNVFKNLRAEPPYSVPQIDEKIRSLRVKRYLTPGNKGQHNENFEAEGIVGRK